MLESDLFWTIITILSGVIEWIVLKVVLDELSNLKRRKIILYISLLIPTSIITILTLIEFNPYIKLFLGIVAMYIVYIYNYDVGIRKCLFVILIYSMVLIGFDALAFSIIVKLNLISDMSELLDRDIFKLELTFLSKSLLLSLIPIIKEAKFKIGLKNKVYIYIAIPILGNITSIIVIFRFIFKYEYIDNIDSFVIMITSIILCISNISLIGILSRIMRDYQLKLENRIIKEKIDIQCKYYSMVQEVSANTRKLYHDMNNHMICIQKIYGINELADNYIKDINNQLKDCNLLFNTNNLILDVILNEKNIICKKNNIDFMSDINFSKCNFIDMTDICSIFSNMLDNAIEACIKIKKSDIKKEIKLKGSIVNKFFIIKCENTKTNDIIFDKNKIITDKEDKFLHGIGISSIKKSVEKYNGNMEIDSIEDKFTVTIYIPLSKKIPSWSFNMPSWG